MFATSARLLELFVVQIPTMVRVKVLQKNQTHADIHIFFPIVDWEYMVNDSVRSTEQRQKL